MNLVSSRFIRTTEERHAEAVEDIWVCAFVTGPEENQLKGDSAG
jgi:hypothetical protein